MMKSRQMIVAAAAALMLAPGGAFRAVSDAARFANRVIDLRPPRVSGSTRTLRTSRRQVAQDKRDAAKRRNQLRAKGQYRQAVR